MEFERSYRDTVPIRGVTAKPITQMAPVSKTHGKLCFVCPICQVSFERFACWIRRGQQAVYCSRACSYESKKIVVEVGCVVCGESMLLKPSQLPKKVTCSYKCMRLKRLKKEVNYGCLEYLAVIHEVENRGKCSRCDAIHGPWVVEGVTVKRAEGSLPVADGSSAILVCRHCHMKKISPEGHSARYTP